MKPYGFLSLQCNGGSLPAEVEAIESTCIENFVNEELPCPFEKLVVPEAVWD